MSMVDNRVVKMTFDNAEFEKKIKRTMQSLSEFEKSLKMDGAAAGFEKIKNAADKLNLSALGEKVKEEASKIGLASSEASGAISEIDDAAQNADFSQLSSSAEDAVMDINNAAAQTDMSPVVDAANDAAEGFNMLEAVATGVLIGIGQQITNLATGGLASVGGKIKEFTLDPMIDGLKEYETQIGSIQTIMANTGLNFSADEDIALVNDKLDELNEYADLTIYNFTEMTRNIGTFTAAGVDLDTSVSAIKGIANLAALSGSNSQQASTAMYQLSQALAAGTLKLQDWNSVVNAGMGGEVFQNALKETARAHGVAVDEMIEDAGSFRESLQDGWITSEILTETLNHMAISYKKVGDESYNAALEEMTANGYTKEQAEEILRLAKVAEQSATKVRTWSQLWDTVKEAIGSKWSQIWRNFIGDFKQATDTFTFLSNTISDGVDALFGGLVRTSEAFQESGAWEIIFGGYLRDENGEEVLDDDFNFVRIEGAIDHLAQAIEKPLSMIKMAFSDTFHIENEDLSVLIVQLSLAFNDFTESLILSDDAADGLYGIFRGVSEIFKVVIQIVTDLSGVFFNFIGILRTFTDPLLDAVLVLGGEFGRTLVQIGGYFREIRSAVLEALSPLGEAFQILLDVIGELLGMDNFATSIRGVSEAFGTMLDKIWKIVDLPGLIRKAGEGLEWFLNKIGDLTGWNAAIEEADRIIEETGEQVSVLDIFIENLLKNPVVAFFKGIFDAIIGIPGKIIDMGNSIADLFSKTEEGAEATDNVQEKVTILSSIINVLKGAFSVLTIVIKTLFDIIVSIGTPIFTLLWDLLSSIGNTVKNVVVFAFHTLVNIVSTLMMVFGGLAGAGIIGFVKLLQSFADIAVRLASAIGGLIGRLWDFFTSWKPIKDIINTIQKFKDKIKWFLNVDIPKMIFGSRDDVVDASKNVRDRINDVKETLEKFIDYISNVSAEQFIQDAKNKVTEIIEAIKDKLNEFASFITHFNPIDAFKNVIVKIENLREVFYSILDAIFDYLDETFPDFAETFEEVYDILFNVITGLFDGIEKLVGWIAGPLISVFGTLKNVISIVKNNSEDIPSFIANLLGIILLLVANGISDLINLIGGIIFYAGLAIVLAAASIINLICKTLEALINGDGLEGVKNAFLNFGSGLLTTLKEKLVGVSPAFKTAFDKIEEFFNKSGDNARTWKDAALDAFDTFVEYLQEVPGKLKGILDNIKTGISNAFETVVGTLAGFEGPVGKIFESIKKKMDDAKNKVQETAEEVPSAFDTIVNKVKEAAKKMAKAVKEFFFGPEEAAESIGEMAEYTEGGAQTIGNVAKMASDMKNSEGSGVFGIIANFFGDVTDPIIDKLKKIPEAIGSIINSIAENITLENVYKVSKIVRTISKCKTLIGLGNFFTGVGKLTKTIAKKIDKKENGTIKEKLRDLAITFAIIGATLWVISTIENPWECVAILGAVELVLLAAEAVSALLVNKFGKGGTEMLNASLSLLALCFAILLMMKTIEQLTAFDFIANLKGVGLFAAILVVLGGIAVLISHIGGNNTGKGMMMAAASLMIMALAARMMIGPLKTICEFALLHNEEELNKCRDAIAAFALFIIAMGGALQLAGDHAIAASIGFILMGVALKIISSALLPIVEAAKLDWESVRNVFIIMGLLILEFAAIAALVDDGSLLKAGTAVLLFSLGVSFISSAITALTKFAHADPIATWSAFAILALMIGEFAAISAFIDDGSLIKAGEAIALFSVGVLILSIAISTLAGSDGDINTAAMALAGLVAIFGLFATIISFIPGAAETLPLLGVAFIAFGAGCLLLSIALQNTVDAIIKLATATPILVMFANAVSQNLPQFIQTAVALTALGISFAIFGPMAIIAGAGMMLLATGMTMLGAAIPGMILCVPLLVTFATVISQHVVQFGLAAVGLAAIGAALMIFGPGAMIAGLGLNLLSSGIRNFLILIIQLPTLLEAAGNSVGILLQMLPEAFRNMWEALSIWWTETAWPKIQEVGGAILGKLTELKDKFVEWWTTTAWPVIQEKLGQFWEWFQTTALPKLQEIGSMLLQKLGEFKDKFVEWWTTTAWPTIKSKIGELWIWFKTEGIPKLKEIGRTIFEKLGELLSKFGNWVINDGLPAAANAVKDIVGKAKDTFGPKIEAFITDIPNIIGGFISGIWDKLTGIGADIIRGIAEGISGFDASEALNNALNFMSNMIPQNVKDFFNIGSPSKLMEEEVGQWIPAGIAKGIEKYGIVAVDSATKLGENTLGGFAAVMDNADLNTNYSPSITPVLNMDKASSGLDNYESLMSDSSITKDVNTSGQITGEIGYSAKLASKLDDEMSATNNMTSSLEGIHQAIQSNNDKTEGFYNTMNGNLSSLNEEAGGIKALVENGKNVYLDSGALVGAMASDIDNELGFRAVLAERGVH